MTLTNNTKPAYHWCPERLACRNCGYGETSDSEWPIRTTLSACPRCKQRALVWMRFEEPFIDAGD